MEPIKIRSITSTFGFIFITCGLIIFGTLLISQFFHNKALSPLFILLATSSAQYLFYAKAYFVSKKYKAELVLKDDALVIFDTEIKLEEIRRIIVRGYFTPSYYIQLKGRKFIKPAHQFKFSTGQPSTEDIFTKWVKEKNIKLESSVYPLGTL